MSMPYFHLAQIADSIGNLTDNDLQRLARILLKESPLEAGELTSSLNDEFKSLDRELGTNLLQD